MWVWLMKMPTWCQQLMKPKEKSWAMWQLIASSGGFSSASSSVMTYYHVCILCTFYIVNNPTGNFLTTTWSTQNWDCFTSTQARYSKESALSLRKSQNIKKSQHHPSERVNTTPLTKLHQSFEGCQPDRLPLAGPQSGSRWFYSQSVGLKIDQGELVLPQLLPIPWDVLPSVLLVLAPRRPSCAANAHV